MTGEWNAFVELPLGYEINAILDNRSSLFAFGSFLPREDYERLSPVGGLMAQKAIVVSIDRTTKKWTVSDVGPGEIVSVSNVHDGQNLYALGKVYSKDGSWSSYLAKSSNYGHSWSLNNNVNNKIIGISFYSDSFGYSWSNDKLYRTTNGGEIWEYIDIDVAFSEYERMPHGNNDGNLFVYEKEYLYLINKTGETTTYSFGKNVNIKGFVQEKNGNIIISKNANNGRVYLSYVDFENGLVEIKSFKDFEPENLYLNDKIIVIYGGLLNKSMPYDVVYMSRNLKEWRTLEIPSSKSLNFVYLGENMDIYGVFSKRKISQLKL